MNGAQISKLSTSKEKWSACHTGQHLTLIFGSRILLCCIESLFQAIQPSGDTMFIFREKHFTMIYFRISQIVRTIGKNVVCHTFIEALVVIVFSSFIVLSRVIFKVRIIFGHDYSIRNHARPHHNYQLCGILFSSRFINTYGIFF